MTAIKLKEGVFWVGARDWNRKIFDALIPLPMGTSYNSYFIQGKDKTALIDTVNPGFEQELFANIAKVGSVEKLDYLVMNHAEPDHAGAIPKVMEAASRAVLVCTKKGAEMAEKFYQVPRERIKAVEDGEEIPLGGKTLKFIHAPWLHWPETMFTWLPEDRILFPCDFMGFHSAQDRFDDESEEMLALAKSYFGEIMMPFRKMGAKALEKIKDLDIEIIAPSHGPVNRNPKVIMDYYRKWTGGETEEKAVIVYVTMWNSTEQMVKAAAEALEGEGIMVRVHDLTRNDLGNVAKDLVDARAIVLGAPTVLGGMHPLALFGASLVRSLRPPAKFAAVLSSYGWSGGALKQAEEVLGPSGLELVGAFQVKGPPTDEELEKVRALGRELAEKIKAG